MCAAAERQPAQYQLPRVGFCLRARCQKQARKPQTLSTSLRAGPSIIGLGVAASRAATFRSQGRRLRHAGTCPARSASRNAHGGTEEWRTGYLVRALLKRQVSWLQGHSEHAKHCDRVPSLWPQESRSRCAQGGSRIPVWSLRSSVASRRVSRRTRAQGNPGGVRGNFPARAFFVGSRARVAPLGSLAISSGGGRIHFPRGHALQRLWGTVCSGEAPSVRPSGPALVQPRGVDTPGPVGNRPLVSGRCVSGRLFNASHLGPLVMGWGGSGHGRVLSDSRRCRLGDHDGAMTMSSLFGEGVCQKSFHLARATHQREGFATEVLREP